MCCIPQEAREAAVHGVDGIIVSNHGGRQIDGAASSIEALPAVVDAVAGSMPVLLDGGVRRGADVVKALALGASALPDRPPAALGARRRRRSRRRTRAGNLRNEIDRVMGLCGVTKISEIGADLIHRPKYRE